MTCRQDLDDGAVGGYALWNWWAPSLIAFLGAYDIWRDLKVRALLKNGERELGDDRSRKH